MGTLRWTPELMDRVERAARLGQRVSLSRRGTEYVVIVREVRSSGNREQMTGYLPMTGEELTFRLDDLDCIHFLGGGD